jgi:hypothetical protein
MSNIANDNIKDTIRDLYDLICFLESELECAGSQGRYDDADQVAVELYDARKELKRLEEYFA